MHDVHSAQYRCKAINAVGKIISGAVHVNAGTTAKSLFFFEIRKSIISGVNRDKRLMVNKKYHRSQTHGERGVASRSARDANQIDLTTSTACHQNPRG